VIERGNIVSKDSAMLVQKLWDYCNVLRDDGVSYGDYVEQLTYLLFLKMAGESEKFMDEKSSIPDEYKWEELVKLEGDELETHYRHTLENLSSSSGMLGLIFRKSQNKIQDPAKLKRLINLISEETWMGMDVDIKGDIYEGLLQKNAEDVKSGAGQYFTPRPLIKAIVEVVKPKPMKTICDPACGTGGFFLAANDYMRKHSLNKEQQDFLKYKTFKGWEIVDGTARLCVMNMYLHGIGGEESPVTVKDSLCYDSGDRFDYVLTNPPFGKKSSITIMNGNGKASKKTISYERQDFWTTTSNKQLNFLQHIKTILKINGTAAVIIPDNVLFEGGAGETVRKKLLNEFDFHTLLRLPTGLFYAKRVKANVMFFQKKKKSEKAATEKLWIYDLRTNYHFTLKTNPLKYEDLKDFIKCYNPENRFERKESERFRMFTYEELIERNKVNLNIFWLKDKSLEDTENLPEPEKIAEEISEDLQFALEQFQQIIKVLNE